MVEEWKIDTIGQKTTIGKTELCLIMINTEVAW